MIFNILFMYIVLFCVFVFYFVYSVFLYCFMYRFSFCAVSLLFLYKSTDSCHQVETQLQYTNIISYTSKYYHIK
jgi:hypothetical protein